MELEDWKKAGKIAAEVLEYGKSLVKENALLLDVADKILAKIKEKGAEPAFPVNISMNELAAHYTPSKNDETTFSDQLVKLDIGVHVNGAIGDTACTIDLSGKYSDLVKASKEALDAAIKAIKPGIQVNQIGAEVEKIITSYGFEPVRNLSGHQLQEFQLHGGVSIPNYESEDTRVIEKGMTVAIEPFATDGAGVVIESGTPEIFMLLGEGRVRSMITRNVMKEMLEFNGLPFAKRWLQTKGVDFALREMKNARILKEYPPLADANKGMVSQAEHTVYIGDNVEILTKA